MNVAERTLHFDEIASGMPAWMSPRLSAVATVNSRECAGHGGRGVVPLRANLRRLDLVTLSLFSLVSRSGSISKGAHMAHLTIGAVSKRLADLEDGIGAPLFERHSRGVTLTHTGRVLQQHAQRILDGVEQMSADLLGYAKSSSGVVRILGSTSSMCEFVPGIVADFSAANASTRVELEERPSQEIVQGLLSGLADVGFFAAGTPELGLQTFECRSERLVLVVSNSNALAKESSVCFEQALEHDFVTLGESSSLGQLLGRQAAAVGKKLRVSMRAHSFDATGALVAANLGIAVVTETVAKLRLGSLSIKKIPLNEHWASRRTLVGARDFEALPKQARLFLDHVRGMASIPTLSPDGVQQGLSGGSFAKQLQRNSLRVMPV